MKRFLCCVLIFIAALSLTAIAETVGEPVSIGPYTLMPASGWSVNEYSLVQKYVQNADGSITDNLQFFEYYSGFGMSYEDLLVSAGDDYGIAEMIVEASLASTYDETGSPMFATYEKEYTTVNGCSCIIYYGQLDPGFYDGSYCASLVVSPDGVLSNMVFSYDADIDPSQVRAFHDAVLSCTYDGNTPIFVSDEPTQDVTGSALAHINSLLHGGEEVNEEPAEVTELECISFTTPAGWVLGYHDGYQANYTCGNASIALNAYADGLLIQNAGSLTDAQLAERLIALGSTSITNMGMDPSEVNFVTAALSSGDVVVYFGIDARETSYNGYVTSAMFVTEDNTVALISIITSDSNVSANQELLATAVNMYYSGDVVQAYQIPDTTQPAIAEETTPTVTVPNAAVLSVSGTSLTNEENSALTDAIIYVSTNAFSYDGLVDQLITDGYTYDVAVFAADNCGIEWDDWKH